MPVVTPRFQEVRDRLATAMPEPQCELDHRSAWQLLVATILSAQSTDKRVNMVTPSLFERWPTPAALAAAARPEIEEAVRTTGFFRNKAKSIQGTARRIVQDFGGEVPRTLEELITLPGVARKTANVVLGTAYRIPTGIAVDTHARRVANRVGLTGESKPDRIEKALCETFDRDDWIDTGHRLVLHGRYVCRARKPDCARCPINELCPARESEPAGSWEARAEREGRVVASRGEAP